jgi:hypothetical protein
MWNEGNLTIQNTKVLSGEAAKKGGLEKREGNPFNETMRLAFGLYL